MLLRRGTYIVPTNRWYIERAVWLIAGFVLLSSTALAVLLNPVCILGVVATGLVSINVALTGFCPIGSLLQLLGFTPMLGADKPSRWNLYFLKIDRWYLERRIYVTVGINITLGSLLFLTHSQWLGAVHYFRRRHHDLVRINRLLHSREYLILGWRRTAAQSERPAVRPMCQLYYGDSMRKWSGKPRLIEMTVSAIGT